MGCTADTSLYIYEEEWWKLKEGKSDENWLAVAYTYMDIAFVVHFFKTSVVSKCSKKISSLLCSINGQLSDFLLVVCFTWWVDSTFFSEYWFTSVMWLEIFKHAVCMYTYTVQVEWAVSLLRQQWWRDSDQRGLQSIWCWRSSRRGVQWGPQVSLQGHEVTAKVSALLKAEDIRRSVILVSSFWSICGKEDISVMTGMSITRRPVLRTLRM